MRVITSRAELRAALGDTHPGLVPTMGALHDGHLALIRQAVSEQPATVVSIFVNPAQFNDPADLAKYPRDLDRDLALIEAAGADLVFAPPVEEIYPPGFATSVEVSGLSDQWEGASRPGHFRGVATVVTILLNLVRPDRAYFGEKDYQQLLIIRRLAADLALPGEIIGCPTIRDADGLALSSRNVRLTPGLRQQARLIPRALTEISHRAAAGETDCARLLAAGQETLVTGPDLRLDYLAIVDPADLSPLTTLTGPARVIAAVYAGDIRLIDNLALSSPSARKRDLERPVISSRRGVPLGHLSFPIATNDGERFLPPVEMTGNRCDRTQPVAHITAHGPNHQQGLIDADVNRDHN